MAEFKTLELAIKFHHEAEKLVVKDNLRDQLLRASTSIVLNLSEGNAKNSVRDKKRFFQMAYGSLRECQTIFKLLEMNDVGIMRSADHLGSCLYKLLKSKMPTRGGPHPLGRKLTSI